MGADTGPIAIETRVGWVLSGPIESNVTEQSIIRFVISHTLRVDALAGPADVGEG